MQSSKFSKYYVSWLIVLILLGAFLVRFYFLNIDREIMPSDEAEYAVMIKSFEHGRILFQWPFYRPFLMQLIESILLKAGGGMGVLYGLSISVSICSVFLVYCIGKDLWNAEVGIIAAFLCAFFPEEIVYSLSLLLNGVALMWWLLAIYLFQRAYRTKKIGVLYLTGVVTGIAILVYTQNIVLSVFFLLFLLVTEGPSFLKKKRFLIFFLIQIGMYAMNFVYSYIWFGNPLKMVEYGLWLSLTDTSSRVYREVIVHFLTYLPSYIGLLVIPFLGGIIILIVPAVKKVWVISAGEKAQIVRKLPLMIGLGIFFYGAQYILGRIDSAGKQGAVLVYVGGLVVTIGMGICGIWIMRVFLEHFARLIKKKESLKKEILLLLWFSVGLFGIAKMVGAFQPRYFLPVVIPLFFYIGRVVTHPWLQVKQRRVMYVVVYLLLVGGVIVNGMNTADLVAESNHEWGVRSAAYWIKEHTNPSDRMIGSGNPSLAFYSERKLFRYPAAGLAGERSYAGLVRVIMEQRPKFMVLYYGPGDIGENKLYFDFLEKNKEEVSLEYRSKQEGIRTDIYRLKYNADFL